MKKIKQGNTKWKVVVYDPGDIEGYDEQYVACVYPCFVTKVSRNTVWYNTTIGPYLCEHGFWNNKLFPSFRKAVAEAKRRIANIEEDCK